MLFFRINKVRLRLVHTIEQFWGVLVNVHSVEAKFEKSAKC